MTDPMLHVYGQYLWHDDVQIVGNALGLSQLRDAIDKALNEGRSEVGCMFAGDGEGYDVTIALHNDDWQEWRLFTVPYTAETAIERRVDAVDPRYLPNKNE